jgi:CheY-like chemotaxis protein
MLGPLTAVARWWGFPQPMGRIPQSRFDRSGPRTSSGEDRSPPVTRLGVRPRFRADDHDVVEAENGCVALERVRENVDLVRLPHKRPDVDGVTALRRSRDLDSDVHVILLTAHAGVETTVEAMKIGARPCRQQAVRS